ncbi:MAG TPA: thioesterase family protein [Hyphomicrobiaceae bacterium]|nr:thioesterase family protein [Hyphomicrobiaceae bacterium]
MTGIDTTGTGSTRAARHSAPSPADYAVITVEKLRFADTDRNGHITNTVFAACCQNARMELLCDRRRVPVPADTHFVIARLVLEFRAEMHWPGMVEVGTRIDWIRKSSLLLAQALFIERRCVAVAESVVALVDSTTRRSLPIPFETAHALRSMSAPGVNASMSTGERRA